MPAYDALIVVSFGGPEGPDDVIPFLENVLRGRNVPRDRMLEVADHYMKFGGKSPINEQNRALVAALASLLSQEGPQIPVYFGNRNWHPLLPATLRDMREDGVQRALAFVTSAFSSYSGCRQYLEDIAAARAEVGEGAPGVDVIRRFYNHPRFIEAVTARTRDALATLSVPDSVPLLMFTAHSIPTSMADSSPYVAQLQEAAGLVAQSLGLPWRLCFQSRSGPPTQPWLEPDVNQALRNAHAEGTAATVVVPLGFLSDHIEVLYDLDEEARATAASLSLPMARAATVGTHPTFVAMIRDLVLERIADPAPRAATGTQPPWPDQCPVDCCPPPRRPARP